MPQEGSPKAKGASKKAGAARAGSPKSPLPPDCKRLGKYEILRQIGAGGMGAVYLARDSELKRTVALKVLPKERATNPTLVKRFRSEARTAAQLKHDHIVTVYEAGEADGYLYIALEYVEGTDVHELIRKRGVIPVRRSIEIVQQVALALQHIYERGVVHRDIKPSNLLVTHDGTVKLTDLGLARSLDDSQRSNITRAGTTVGTVDYMPPEQARDSKAADIRSDIYSLGCTWFHMLTGRPPFPQGDLLAKLNAHANQPPPDPRRWNRSVPESVVAVLHRMMAKKPEDRYQTPAELLEDLETVAASRPEVTEQLLEALAGQESSGGYSQPFLGTQTGPLPLPPRVDSLTQPTAERQAEPGGRWWLPPKWVWAAVAGALAVFLVALLVFGFSRALEGPGAGNVRKGRPVAADEPPAAKAEGSRGRTPDQDRSKPPPGAVASSQSRPTGSSRRRVTLPVAKPERSASQRQHVQLPSASDRAEAGEPERTALFLPSVESYARRGEADFLPRWVRSRVGPTPDEDWPTVRVSDLCLFDSTLPTLQQALDQLPPEGGVVELDGAGPFFLREAELVGKTVWVRPAGQSEPVVVLLPNGRSRKPLLKVVRGGLTLQGVHLVVLADRAAAARTGWRADDAARTAAQSDGAARAAGQTDGAPSLDRPAGDAGRAGPSPGDGARREKAPLVAVSVVDADFCAVECSWTVLGPEGPPTVALEVASAGAGLQARSAAESRRVHVLLADSTFRGSRLLPLVVRAPLADVCVVGCAWATRSGPGVTVVRQAAPAVSAQDTAASRPSVRRRPDRRLVLLSTTALSGSDLWRLVSDSTAPDVAGPDESSRGLAGRDSASRNADGRGQSGRDDASRDDATEPAASTAASASAATDRTVPELQVTVVNSVLAAFPSEGSLVHAVGWPLTDAGGSNKRPAGEEEPSPQTTGWLDGAATTQPTGGVRWVLRNSVLLGWPCLLKTETVEVTDWEQWLKRVSGQAVSVECSAEGWPQLLDEPLWELRPEQLDSASLSLGVPATDGGRPGCRVDRVVVPSGVNLKRAEQYVAAGWPLDRVNKWTHTVRLEAAEQDLGRFVSSDQCLDGTTVVVSGSGGHYCSPLLVTGKSVRIRFEHGEQPLVLWPKAPGRGRELEAFVSVRDGHVELVDAVFAFGPLPKNRHPRWFLKVRSGSFTLRNVHVLGPRSSDSRCNGLIQWRGRAASAGTEGQPRLTGVLVNSYLVSPGPVVDGVPRATLFVDNSLLLSLTRVVRVPPLQVRPELRSLLDFRSATLVAGEVFFDVPSKVPWSGGGGQRPSGQSRSSAAGQDSASSGRAAASSGRAAALSGRGSSGGNEGASASGSASEKQPARKAEVADGRPLTFLVDRTVFLPLKPVGDAGSAPALLPDESLASAGSVDWWGESNAFGVGVAAFHRAAEPARRSVSGGWRQAWGRGRVSRPQWNVAAPRLPTALAGPGSLRPQNFQVRVGGAGRSGAASLGGRSVGGAGRPVGAGGSTRAVGGGRRSTPVSQPVGVDVSRLGPPGAGEKVYVPLQPPAPQRRGSTGGRRRRARALPQF